MSVKSFSALIAVFIFASAHASAQSPGDIPSRDDLTGTWQWSSYLLDPSKNVPPSDPRTLGTSEASLWATGELVLRQNPVAGESVELGELTFPTGVKLKVSGRRVKGEGDIEEFVFRGTGPRRALTAAEAPGPVEMDFQIRGTFSAPWPSDTGELSIRGYIRNVTGDPFAPGAIGAFVLRPAKVTTGEND